MQDQNNSICRNLPVGLASIAGHRDLITTIELAEAFNVASQTIRKNYCLTGYAYGIKPTKIGNRLLWPVEKVATVLSGGNHD
jgi:hypothetical protein